MRKLAEFAGLTESAVRHFESGLHATMEAESLSRLATVLGARLPYLLHGTGSEPSETKVKAAVERARKAAGRTGAAA